MKKLRKALVVSVMVITVLSLSMVTGVGNLDAAAQAGDLIKMDGLSSVYYLAADGKRYVFPNEATYFSWYGDFSGVVVIPQSELESYSLGANVTIRPGTKLIKITTDPKVYAVEPNGDLVHVPDEATAITLYGADWATRVVDIADAFFTNYNVTGNQVSASAYPTGTLVQFGGSADVSYIDATGNARKVADEASFLANRFKWADVIVSTLTAPTAGTDVTGSEEGMTDTSSGAGGTAGAGTGLTVSLASDTPASANFPEDVDNIEFVKINFTASSDGDVVVNSMNIARFGLGSDGDFDAITLYEGATKLGSTRTSFNSDHEAVFNLGTGWAIPAGTTKSLTIKAKVNTAAGAANQLGIASASDVTTNGASVSGAFSIAGNAMQAVTITDLGAITIDGQGSATVTKKIGTTDVQVASFSLEETSGKEDASLKSISLKNMGTAKDTAAGNFYLKQGSTVIAGPVSMISDYVTFDLGDSPYLIGKSDTVTFKVIADILDGDGTTIEFILKNDADINITGSVYGYSLTLTKTEFNATTCGDTTLVTIDGSELNISFDSTSQDTPDETKNVEFGKFILSAGQDVKITSMTFNIDETDGSGSVSNNKDIVDLELVGNDGSIYSLAMTAGSGGDTDDDNEIWSFTDEEVMVYASAATTLTVRGDIPASVGGGDQYHVTMTVNTTNLVAETVAGGDAIDNFSVSSITGKKTTVKSPSLLVKTPALDNDDIVKGTEGVVVFKGRLEAGVASIVTVERMRFEGADGTYGGAVAYASSSLDTANILSAVLYVEGTAEQTITSFTEGELDFNEVNIAVPAGTTNGLDFEVKVDITGETLSSNKTLHLQLDTVTAKDSQNDTVTVTQEDGSTAIANGAELEAPNVNSLKGTGILYVSMDIEDTSFNKDRYVIAGNDAWIGKIKLRAQYESIKIQDLKLTNDTADVEDSTTQVCLYTDMTGDAVACSTLGTNQIVFFDDIDHVVAPGTSYLYVKVTTPNIGDATSATADSGEVFAFTISTTTAHIVAEGVDSGDPLTIGNGTGGATEGEIVFDDHADGTVGTWDETTDGETGDTKAFTVSGSQVTAVTFESTYSGTSLATNINGSGDYNVAIIGITNSSNNNTDSEGVALNNIIKELNFRTKKDTATIITAATIERIGGTQSAVALNIDAASTTGQTSGLWTQATLDNASTGIGADAKIAAGETAYFLVVASITVAGNVDTITVSFDDLNGDDTESSVRWDDGTTTFNNLYLDYTKVDGVKIDEAT